jgi:predicted pyridoxine 5'-phosphate oxidase superfamily flavin-nucleotide-binding protein
MTETMPGPLTWAELEQAAPEIAGHGRELIESFQFVLVGTLTKDGSPRVTPVEAYLVDGHLLANMMPQSLKALDLLRDPRVYVHAPVTGKEGSPEFKLAGRAEVLTDETLKQKLDDLFWELIKWRPRPDSHYFEFLAERAAWVSYAEDGTQHSVRWQAGAPEKHLQSLNS